MENYPFKMTPYRQRVIDKGPRSLVDELTPGWIEADQNQAEMDDHATYTATRGWKKRTGMM